MRLLADENLPQRTVEALRRLGHDVTWVRLEAPGSGDERVLAQALSEDRVLVTADKDFGELAFRRRLPAAAGVILLRVRGTAEVRSAALVAALETREDWAGQFAVVTNDRVRLTPLPPAR